MCIRDRVLHLWDYMFLQYRNDFNFLSIEELALAMILHLRGNLMKSKKPIELIQKVQKFPKIKSALPLVANAHKIKSKLKIIFVLNLRKTIFKN